MQNFSLKNNFYILRKSVQVGFFQAKTEEVIFFFWVLCIAISLGTKFKLKLTALLFWTKFDEKKHLQWKATQNDHWILDILTGTKFYLKLTILNILTKFAKSNYFNQKLIKRTSLWNCPCSNFSWYQISA